ncbi:MAG: YfhO family protein, partial [Erysipelotrichaceae bacterium]|nr:YfhO family protein [Erysipelotrichaceae bacterium]
DLMKIDDSNKTMKIDIHLDDNQDIYLSLSNFEYLNNSNLVYYADINVEMDGIKQSIQINKENYIYYNGIKDYLVYLGNYSKGDYTITLSFKDKGNYSYDSIQVLGQTTDQIDEDISQLKEDVLTNEYLGTNYVSGDIELNEDKFICLSIPYSSGWKAYVDGEEVTLQRANYMYMGIMLDEGSHHVELKYETPGLKIGAIISCASLVILVVYVRKRRVYKHEKVK